MTGFARSRSRTRRTGSLIKRNGKVVGSRLAAQSSRGRSTSTSARRRPSPAYNAGATTFANLGPTSPDLAKLVAGNAQAILKLEGPYNPGLTIHDIPVDAVTTSGSGIDPDISPAYARCRRAASPPSATCRSRPCRS